RSDHYQAERQGVLDTKASTQKQIEDLERERNGLAFRRTTKAAVDAAKLLSDAAAKAREQEGGKVGDNCRKRQRPEATAIGAFTKAQENKAGTDRFDEIETELKRLRSKKPEGDVVSADPLKALLSKIIGTWAEMLSAWQKAVFAVVYDLCLVALMISIEVLGQLKQTVAKREAEVKSREAPTATPRAPPVRPEPKQQAREMPQEEQEERLADPGTFLTTFLKPGGSVTEDEVCDAYEQWCSSRGCSPIPRPKFKAAF